MQDDLEDDENEDKKPSAGRRGVQSIEVGSRLLDALASRPGAMHLRELAAAAGMPASKAHRYLTSLINAGLAEQDPVSGRYDLGAMSLRIGLAVLSRRNVVRYATQALIEFNQTDDATAALVVWGERGPTVVAWYDSSQPVLCNLGIGSILQLLRSATGRVFLAYLPRSTTRTMVEKELGVIAAYLPREPIRTKDDVDQLIRHVRAARVGLTHEELVPGLSAVAAPVFDHQGRIVAAILHVGFSGQIHSRAHPARQRLLEVADSLSIKLGFDPSIPNLTLVEVLEAQGSGDEERGGRQGGGSGLKPSGAGVSR